MVEENLLDWGLSSVVQHVPGKHKVLGLITSTETKREKENLYVLTDQFNKFKRIQILNYSKCMKSYFRDTQRKKVDAVFYSVLFNSRTTSWIYLNV